ncbi:hypothetical protein [Microbacterium sp. No. 7]|uniref:hypothetical protein n=1 Tax=Microbacterium sp. No. 7 TaxID=1714373 RepID=UPI0006D26917|nr:hypothetical protein [Microbacterium sp. No. 7]ALJ20731.1 hypothetical protein AOA12_12800 [Microbacterium sp. No. 7]
MGYGERNTWSGLIAGIAGIAVYVAIVAPQLGSRPAGEIDWLWPMVWTVGGAIVVSIVLGIVWGIVAGARDPEERHVEDVRDRDIARLGDRVGQAFLVLAMVGTIALCAVSAEWFWIANTVYAGLALSSIVGGVARVIVYRGGMP